jgi:hypothetical protein
MTQSFMERLLEIKVSEEYGTILEEVELICTMTGHRRRLLLVHDLRLLGGDGEGLRDEGSFRCVELEPS